MLIIVLFFLLFLFDNNCRSLTIPYPYYNREYSIRESNKILINECCFDYKNGHNLNSWELIIDGVAFFREGKRAYSAYGENKKLATVFHGRDSFDISDMYPGSKIMYVDYESRNFETVLMPDEYIKYEGSVRPNYFIKEQGVNFAADIIKKINENTTFLLQLRLPIVQQDIQHQSKWNDISFDNTLIYDKRLYMDDLNFYFKARNDYLYENRIIQQMRSKNDMKRQKGITFLSSDDPDYFLNKNYFEKDNLHDEDNFIIINSYHDLYNIPDEEDNKSIDTSYWYAFTEFNQRGVPAYESMYYYLKIRDAQKKNDLLFLDITQGKFLNKNFKWDSMSRRHIAPFDLQFNITKLIYENIILQGLLSFVIPIKKYENKDSYIEKSYFNDGYAIRFGSQLSCDINYHYKLVGYGSWQYYFPTLQSIPAIFEGVNAYGLTPFYINGKVSWHEWYLAGHLVIKYNDSFGVDLGYQYINKSQDSVVPECHDICLIDGQSYKLNYAEWEKFSRSIANLLTFNAYYYFNMIQFDFGVRGVISGINAIKLTEYSFRFGIDF